MPMFNIMVFVTLVIDRMKFLSKIGCYVRLNGFTEEHKPDYECMLSTYYLKRTLKKQKEKGT